MKTETKETLLGIVAFAEMAAVIILTVFLGA